ncbi:hypothetical protein DFH06DRAFT_1010455 [Mycena polygramma]|nr:hypothetical protein DFH06DRAFT_1010455 [Mycena polygramma]
MAFIHAGLAAVVIPAWIDRPPVNLGEKAHGKLKADNWLVLFTIFFPLIIPELWHHSSASRKEEKLLQNFADLIAATNILCSYTTSPAEADAYLEHYVDYLKSSKSLFPGLTFRPNHHYALHNGAQLKWWGPLIQLGEFLYESLNGKLQKIKTNNHMWELDLTMLRQICRRGRLLASIRDTARDTANSVVGAVMRILSPGKSRSEETAYTTPLTPREEVAHNGSGAVLEPTIYELIFEYWNRAYSPPYIRGKDLTYDLLDTNVNVFPSRAVRKTHFEHKTRLFSTFEKHNGNSSISFRHPSSGHKDTGFIRSIWSVALQGQIRTFVVVEPHVALTAADQAKTPYFKHPEFACIVRYSNPKHPQDPVVIEPHHVIAHLPYYPRPKGTFGIKQKITIFVDSLHRNRD